MAEKTKVTRIRAEDTRSKSTKVVKTSKAAKKPTQKAPKAQTNKKKNIFSRVGGYFKGAWKELRQVRWPNRRATWGLTLAVIVFSVTFMLLITLLDTFFKWLFEIIIT